MTGSSSSSGSSGSSSGGSGSRSDSRSGLKGTIGKSIGLLSEDDGHMDSGGGGTNLTTLYQQDVVTTTTTRATTIIPPPVPAGSARLPAHPLPQLPKPASSSSVGLSASSANRPPLRPPHPPQRQRFVVDPSSAFLEESVLLQSRLDTQQTALGDAQTRLTEISRLMGVFCVKVAEQTELCDAIGAVAIEAVENVTGAHKHLRKVAERGSGYRLYVMVFFLVASFVLLILDFVTSKKWI
eukprot:GHVS01082262.1.p1 GENE.GHVS01082262.1~~GHVS01082262.1.p1  ORF type:complete len:239 (+),score=77.02 GHVS01082262.1:1-717(+)